MCCLGSSFMQYGCYGENIASHVHLQLVGLIIHVSKPNFLFPKVKYGECINFLIIDNRKPNFWPVASVMKDIISHLTVSSIINYYNYYFY